MCWQYVSYVTDNAQDHQATFAYQPKPYIKEHYVGIHLSIEATTPNVATKTNLKLWQIKAERVHANSNNTFRKINRIFE